ncbi:MAG TPA: FKBP-type peptidyl-prolyl cis-trans isomerase [Planctomycetaceae bacterium]|nr:FKBP-type peptidyl-prolyl cis-trans isomerase [Planctomycetaceae bacterium]
MMGAFWRAGLLLAGIVCVVNLARAEDQAKADDKPKTKAEDKAKAEDKPAVKVEFMEKLADQEVPFPQLPEKAGKISKKAQKDFTQTKSGLKYRVLREGKGITAFEFDFVEVNYYMWLDDGTLIWSAYDEGNTPQVFKLSRSLPGLKEGLQLVKKGGLIELEIPAKLAWDNAPSDTNIPAGATIHVVAEMIDIKGLEFAR